ncbi:hypothetical protein DFH27DRAFT_578747 [Peziza echinospora]|nr:hypothetical protein DFH27DRAFT_578747 [Peziza echinospora]
MPTESMQLAKGTIVCRPTDWVDIVRFIALNYVAHAFTTVTRPGERLPIVLYRSFMAIFCPFTGFNDAMVKILTCSALGKRWLGDDGKGARELKKAFFAGALCTLAVAQVAEGRIRVKGPQELLNGVEYWQSIEQCESLRIHGANDVLGWDAPHGPGLYRLLPVLLPGSDFSARLSVTHAAAGQDAADVPPLELAVTSGGAAAAIAIAQIGFAVYGLYTVRASQLERFGYAAYVFTVVPFALMSVLNLVALMAVPKYPAAYMVRYGELDGGRQWTFPADSGLTAEDVNAMMPGAIASFSAPQSPPRIKHSGPTSPDNIPAMMMGSLITLGIVPFIVILCLTRFDAQQSTATERAWTMTWLASGPLCAIIHEAQQYHFRDVVRKDKASRSISQLLRAIVRFMVRHTIPIIIPGIGGYYAVISMLRRDEACIKV